MFVPATRQGRAHDSDIGAHLPSAVLPSDLPNGAASTRPFAIVWSVFMRGMSSLLVSVATITTLSAGDLREGLMRLPVPGVVSAILLQIVHQTATLAYETRRVASAMAVRGASSGGLTMWRLLSSLPRVWLPRIVRRADRVACAMELRGYCDVVVEFRKPMRMRLADIIALLRNVTIRYEPSSPATIIDVSLSVAAGERVALIGLNGSGKTTILMAAVGLVPHEGTIEVYGSTVSRRNLSEVRDRIGFLFNVPEDQLLFPKVLDDVAFALLRRGLPSDEAMAKAKSALEAVGIDHLAEHSLHHLSHGQKQRVALAGAMVSKPPLLLLDEPSAALDPPGKQAMAKLLQQMPAAMLIATHDIDFAKRFCTRFIMLEQGRLILDESDITRVLRYW
jgi:cobalt/nickel transport system ATP-binding protein